MGLPSEYSRHAPRLRYAQTLHSHGKPLLLRQDNRKQQLQIQCERLQGALHTGGGRLTAYNASSPTTGILLCMYLGKLGDE